MSARILAMAAATFAVLLSIIGCGDGTPTFDPATQYSPESLASELAFRYRTLDKVDAGIVPEKPEPKGAPTTKGGVATKKAPASTLEGLLDDVIQKAASIPKMAPSEACKKVAEIASKDSTFSEADRKTIADRLGQVKD